MHRFWSALGTLGLFLCLAMPARALTINPARSTVTIARGDSQVLSLIIRNDSATPKKYVLGVVGVEQDPEGHPIFKVGSSDAEAWVTPEEPSVTIAPGTLRTVYFAASIPATAAQGVAHFIGLTVVENTENSGGVGIAAKLISLVELQVAGTIQEHGVLNVWRGDKLFVSSLKWPMRVSVTNIGTGSAPLKATVVVTSFITRQKISERVLLGSLLLPGTSRQLTIPLTITSSLLPGIYFVRLNLVYGYTGQQLTRTTWIVYLPKYAQFIVVAVLATALFFVVRFKKRRVV